MKAVSDRQFHYVHEGNSDFLALFPHRFDYIYARPPQPGQTPDWQTETRHPLSDRLLDQASYLYGVRFGAQTNYCLLDIDAGSLYHPAQDPLAIARIVAVLEPIGLVSYVSCTSSYSGGLHLYFPFQQPQSSWELASAVGTLLENGGFLLKPGQLELFPNPKPYVVEGTPSLFNAHRLPMQIGSYLLNQDFQPIWSDRPSFVQQWKLAQYRNLAEAQVIKRILKQAKRKRYCISGKADKFINDLNAEIELGWTDFGQTNYLLGRITMRAYIFDHILTGGVPLEGAALVEAIVDTAQSLPGYREWCRHQHEIRHRAEEWVRCIENSHYFHYGNSKGRYKHKLGESTSELDPALQGLPTWNQQQRESARERIRSAIVDLLETNRLPAGATARFRALTQYGIGGGSLYRHRDLWHPNCLVENPPLPPNTVENYQFDCVEDTSNCQIPSSLLPATDGDKPLLNASGDRAATDLFSTGGNVLSASVFLDKALPSQETDFATQSQLQPIEAPAQQQSHVQRMQQYLRSGDPILVAEAVAQLGSGVVSVQVSSAMLKCTDSVPDLNMPTVLDLPLQSPPPASPALFSSPLMCLLPFDCSDILVRISIELRRLAWTSEQICSELRQLFGKSCQAFLDAMELVQWFNWLTQQRACSYALQTKSTTHQFPDCGVRVQEWKSALDE